MSAAPARMRKHTISQGVAVSPAPRMNNPQPAAAMTTIRPWRWTFELHPLNKVAPRLPMAIEENNNPVMRASPHCSDRAGNSATGKANKVAAISMR